MIDKKTINRECLQRLLTNQIMCFIVGPLVILVFSIQLPMVFIPFLHTFASFGHCYCDCFQTF